MTLFAAALAAAVAAGIANILLVVQIGQWVDRTETADAPLGAFATRG